MFATKLELRTRWKKSKQQIVKPHSYEGLVVDFQPLAVWLFLQYANKDWKSKVDGMSGGDRGGVQELISLIKNTRVPIVCIANDYYDKYKTSPAFP
eukprot:764592-Hanusia_phi.AAC.1